MLCSLEPRLAAASALGLRPTAGFEEVGERVPDVIDTHPGHLTETETCKLLLFSSTSLRLRLQLMFFTQLHGKSQNCSWNYLDCMEEKV